jgi:hypothetical protein
VVVVGGVVGVEVELVVVVEIVVDVGLHPNITKVRDINNTNNAIKNDIAFIRFLPYSKVASVLLDW